jgi:hypothetical protein
MRKRTTQPPRKKSGVPWWGWCIVGFLVLKGCSTADAIVQEHSMAAPVPVEVTL